MILFSSRIEKFKVVYQNKMRRYGICNTTMFGEVLGHEKASLIQNMLPAALDYIGNYT